MKDITLSHVSKVICHGYRTAGLANSFICINRNSEVGHTLENLLAEKAGTETDNHVVYTVITLDGEQLHVECSDDHITIGTKIVPETLY